MAQQYIYAGFSLFAAMIVTSGAGAQTPSSGPSQPSDLELGCPALTVEMGKAGQLLAQTPPSAAGPAAAAPTGVATALASTVGTAKLEEIGRAYQQQQNAQQLANLQVLAARGGVNRGTAGAAIGGLAALQQVAANGGNVQEAARSVVADKASSELAKRIPGGALVGSLMGGMFKKKPKPVAVAAAVPNEANGAQARLSFLTALVAAKGCK